MLSVLMTIYNETDFVEYAIRSCLPYVDHLVVVEGAYQETIKIGASPRSTDGTLDVINKYKDNPKVHIMSANEQTDKDQRNVGLQKIKELNPNGWCLIVDGDEVYEPNTFALIKNIRKQMEKSNVYASYFTSMTFVNDLQHFTIQEFPRLFRITPECEFSNDNFMIWPDKNITAWTAPHVVKFPNIKYMHYSFCKGTTRFLLKKAWWETRFGRKFDYSWDVESDNKINDKNHKIYEFTGRHPAIMNDHHMCKNKVV